MTKQPAANDTRGRKSMKVVHVTNVVAPDKQGGLERYVRELAAQQVRAGKEVVVVAKRRNPEDSLDEVGSDGVRILRYSVPEKARLTYAIEYPVMVVKNMFKTLRRAGVLRNDQNQVVHAHYPIPALALMLAGRRYIYTFHAPVHKEIAGERQGTYALSGPFERLATRAVRLIERAVLRRAETVITLSSFIREEAAALGVSHERFVLIPGGLDAERFGGPGARPETRRPRIFAARRLVERTGVEQLVAAMPLVLAKHPGTELRVAGEGPRREAIESLVNKLDIGSSVILLGRISESQLAKEYREASLSVTPTQYLEGFGLATAESLASGTPALVTPVGANAELVATLSPNLVARDASSEQIAIAINELLDHPQHLREIGGATAREHAADWAWPVVEAAVSSVYSRSVR